MWSVGSPMLHLLRCVHYQVLVSGWSLRQRQNSYTKADGTAMTVVKHEIIDQLEVQVCAGGFGGGQ